MTQLDTYQYETARRCLIMIHRGHKNESQAISRLTLVPLTSRLLRMLPGLDSVHRGERAESGGISSPRSGVFVLEAGLLDSGQVLLENAGHQRNLRVAVRLGVLADHDARLFLLAVPVDVAGDGQEAVFLASAIGTVPPLGSNQPPDGLVCGVMGSAKRLAIVLG